MNHRARLMPLAIVTIVLVIAILVVVPIGLDVWRALEARP